MAAPSGLANAITLNNYLVIGRFKMQWSSRCWHPLPADASQLILRTIYVRINLPIWNHWHHTKLQKYNIGMWLYRELIRKYIRVSAANESLQYIRKKWFDTHISIQYLIFHVCIFHTFNASVYKLKVRVQTWQFTICSKNNSLSGLKFGQKSGNYSYMSMECNVIMTSSKHFPVKCMGYMEQIKR